MADLLPEIEDALLVEAAACDRPLSEPSRARWLGTAEAGEPGRLTVSSAARVWVALDGQRLDEGGDAMWTASLPVRPGKHLLQLGSLGEARASSAVLLWVDAGGSAAWSIVPSTRGADLIGCANGVWGDGVRMLATPDLAPSARRWLEAGSAGQCIADAVDTAPSMRAQSVAMARVGWPVLADRAADRVWTLDPLDARRWQKHQLRVSAAMRYAEVGLLGTSVAAELFAQRESWQLSEDPVVEPLISQASTMTLLTTTGLRREALVRGGQATPKRALILGGVVAGLGLLGQGVDTSVFGDKLGPGGGAGRILAMSLGLVQGITNEIAHRRAKKRLRRRVDETR